MLRTIYASNLADLAADPVTCCVNGEMTLNMNADAPPFLPTIPGVQVIHFGAALPRARSECNRGVIVKATFDKGTCGGCHNPPGCGRQMLQVDLYLDEKRGEYIFNVGDSVSNNGWGKYRVYPYSIVRFPL